MNKNFKNAISKSVWKELVNLPKPATISLPYIQSCVDKNAVIIMGEEIKNYTTLEREDLSAQIMKKWTKTYKFSNILGVF
jgi:hypothetical protein